MKTPTLIITGASALLLTACIPSLNPFYTDKDIVYEPRLVGAWQIRDENKQPRYWRFTEGADRTYQLTVTEADGKQGQFKATLFKLKGHSFLDLIPTNCDYATNQAGLVASAMFPGHLLAHVERMEPELRMAFFNFEWLEDYLKSNPKALPHHLEEDRMLLTASTRQLQHFVLRHLSDRTLFTDYGDLRRETPPEK